MWFAFCCQSNKAGSGYLLGIVKITYDITRRMLDHRFVFIVVAFPMASLSFKQSFVVQHCKPKSGHHVPFGCILQFRHRCRDSDDATPPAVRGSVMMAAKAGRAAKERSRVDGT
jgi:hypothetical protein